VFLAAEPYLHAIYVIEGPEAKEALELLEGSADPFDRWYLLQMSELHLDIAIPEQLHDTRPQQGAWRGWRGWRGRG
jgi:hypothetical protein